MTEETYKEKSLGEKEYVPDTGINVTELISPEDNTSEVFDTPRKTLDELGIDVSSSSPDFSNMGEIGRGGSGIVMRATDAALGRLVAVKLLRPEYRFSREHIERLVREARATAQLEHPNVVPMHSLGVDRKHGAYFTMKKLQGDTLRNILLQLKNGDAEYVLDYPWTKILSIYVKICQGVAYAHSKGVIHRDLKPENILVGRYGEVTVIDWGLVRKMTPVKSSVKLSSEYDYALEMGDPTGDEICFADDAFTQSTMDHFIQGTPRYMAPEQAVGLNSKLDHRCDIYSLGVLLYEILTFKNPFEHIKDESEIMNAVVSADYLRPRHSKELRKRISPEMEAICLKAMSLDKEQRYQTIAELIHDIYNEQGERSVSAYKTPWYSSLHKMIKRNPLKSAVIISSIVAIFASVFSILLLDFFVYKKNIKQIYEMRELSRSSMQELGKLLDDRDILLQNPALADSISDYEAETNQRIEEKENELINNYDQTYLLLSGLSPISKKRSRVNKMRQEIIVERLEFAQKYQRLNEVKRWLNILQPERDKIFAGTNERLKAVFLDCSAYVDGICELHIVSQPFGAEIELFSINHNNEDNSLVVASEAIKSAPLSRLTGEYQLSKGNYLLKLYLPDRPAVLYHLFLTGNEELELLIKLPRNIPENTVYIPAGSCLTGNRTTHLTAMRKVELPGFFVLDRELSFAEYLEFWQSLEDNVEKSRFLPRVWVSPDARQSVPAWSEDAVLIEGLSLDCPVVGISAEAAMAYCRWLSEKLSMTVRLPSADEWEKAARGADGRLYPWGNYFDSSKAFTRENLQASQNFGKWAAPKQFAQDCSIYGVYDMAGNVREWTGTVFNDGTGMYQIKGSSSVAPKRYLPLYKADDTPLIPSDVGFRYVIEYGGE